MTIETSPLPKLFTLAETAAASGLSQRRLRTEIAERRLAYFQPAGRYGKIFVSQADLEVFLRRFRRPARGEEAGAR